VAAALAGHLPLPIPGPLAKGTPGCGYPWPWSVYRWIDGDPATAGRVADPVRFAADLAGFLAALYRIDSAGGPLPGQHNFFRFFRGGPLAVYDAEARDAIAALDGEIDTGRASRRAPRWVSPSAIRGLAGSPRRDMARPAGVGPRRCQSRDLLLGQGRLSAVIDFGCSGVGDPACDMAIAWTFFSGESRRMFQTRLPVDNATWARARGWALWKAMIVLVRALKDDPDDIAETRHVIEEVLTGHQDAA